VIPEAPGPILQQFVRVGREGVCSVTGFIDRTGELFVTRRSKKVLQRSQPAGVGVCFESLPPDSGMSDAVRRLCRGLGLLRHVRGRVSSLQRSLGRDRLQSAHVQSDWHGHSAAECPCRCWPVWTLPARPRPCRLAVAAAQEQARRGPGGGFLRSLHVARAPARAQADRADIPRGACLLALLAAGQLRAIASMLRRRTVIRCPT
jgi:hypothetical protein